MNDLLDSPLQDKTKKFRFRLLTPMIWLGIFIIGSLFYAMHWPFSALLRVVGFAGFAAYNLNAVFYLKGKHIVNDIFIGLSVLWIAVIIWGELFNGGYPFNIEGIIANAVSLFILFTVYAVINLIVYRKRGS